MSKAITLFATLICSSLIFPASIRAGGSAEQINIATVEGLRTLVRSNPTAAALATQAVAILIFPKIVKGGFLVAGQFGEGALIENNSIVAYYSTAAASFGYQAGVERYGYALFFMNAKALDYLKQSHGWSLGAGPSLTIIDAGFSKSFSTSTMHSDVYACVFSQKGLMGGIGIQGAKITQIHPR